MNILIISNKHSDLSLLLERHFKITMLPPDCAGFDEALYDGVFVLGGNADEPITLSPPVRVCIERMQRAGKRVFCEYARAIGGMVDDGVVRTSHHRAVYSGTSLKIYGLNQGDVLDGHYNDCIEYAFKNKQTTPILCYHDYVCAHSNIEMSDEDYKKGRWALWLLNDNTLISSFRLCNFRRARMAPRKSWEAVIRAVVSFVTGYEGELSFESPVCNYEITNVEKKEDVSAAVRRGLDWFMNAGMLKNDGREGAFEGFAHHVSAKDGSQIKQKIIRTDCTCEVAGAFLFDSLLTGNARSREISERLFKFAFDWLQVKEGEHCGMVRWSDVSWETCYQDDVARALLPLLLEQHINGNVQYLDNIKAALDYMVDTTAEDGIRAHRTDISRLTPEKREEIKKSGSGRPSAHYNSYYHAVLLLAYRATGEKRYFDVAKKGLSTLMALYPETARETSETEELCRLILPLAVLYGVSGEAEHYDWLCRVTSDLEKHRHAFGGYAEWDTGYTAKCSRNHTGECALLANNGDPVADLLYSNNWLPLGFAYAYMVTGEARFYELWCKTASFMLSCQIHSADKLLDGAWTRAFDMENVESHGVPHDIGWAPCCIETGWTMGEILMGLQFISLF